MLLHEQSVPPLGISYNRCGWLDQRDQQAIIDYLMEENRVLRGQLRERKFSLTDDECRRLAVKRKALGRMLSSENTG
jgi:hypothetical protein